LGFLSPKIIGSRFKNFYSKTILLGSYFIIHAVDFFPS
jgi:hypothetical protein